MDDKCSQVPFTYTSQHVAIMNCSDIFNLNIFSPLVLVTYAIKNTYNYDDARTNICVVTKLIDLDISCTNNCRHRVKMDNISSSVNIKILYATKTQCGTNNNCKVAKKS
jgi:hypothetical protein